MEVSTADVHATVQAGASWVQTRDIPDVIGWADFRTVPDLAAAAINERRNRGVIVSAAHHFPHPKGFGPANRWMTVVDPLDEVAFRIDIGRVAHHLDGALGAEVLSYRLKTAGPGWTVGDFKYGVGERRRRLVATLDRSFRGVGALDVANYYPSIDLGALRATLMELGVPKADADPLMAMLHAWQDIWNVRGVPVGPEASGLLGNVMLVCVDAEVAERCDVFTRYTDDYLVSIDDEAFAGLVAVVGEALTRISLELNDSKVQHRSERQGAEMLLIDPAISDLARSLSIDAERGVQLVREAIAVEAHAEAPNETRFRWCLKVLLNRGDSFAVPLFEANPSLARMSPKGFGAYMSKMATARKVDHEWLVSTIVAEPTPDTAAVQMHAALACSQVRISKSVIRPVEVLALHPGTNVPLRVAAVGMWAASEGGKLGQALDAAVAVGLPQHRRALIAASRCWPEGRKRSIGLTKLRVVAPEAAPTIQWVEDGARFAA